MSVGGALMIRICGSYVKFYPTVDDVDRNEQIENIELCQHEGHKYFHTVVCNTTLSPVNNCLLERPPIHPISGSIQQIVGLFHHTTYLLLKHVSKDKGTKKFDAGHDFFAPWHCVATIAKYAQINESMVECAVGQHGDMVRNGAREAWVKVLQDFSERFSNYCPFVVQSDFDVLSEVVGTEAKVTNFEEAFSRYMSILYKKLGLLEQVLKFVVHRSNIKTK